MRVGLWVAGVLWVGAVIAGGALASRYAFTPGENVASPARWPEQSHITPVQGRPTLVMLAHPKCACTRAILAELSRLAERFGGRLNIHVLLVKPAGAAPGFARDRVHRVCDAMVLPLICVREAPVLAVAGIHATNL